MRSPLRLAALMLALAGCSSERPGAAFARGDLDLAEREYSQLLARYPESAHAHFNLGTVLVHQRRYEEARSHLEPASRAPDAALRQASFYNVGNSYLEPAFADSLESGREDALRHAIGAYKRALLLRPSDEDAKWNLELARRLLEQEQKTPRDDPSAGGGGGGGAGGGGDQEQGRQNPNPRPASGAGDSPRLSREAAERILDAAETRELGVQRAELRKAQPPSPTAHE